MILAKMVIGRNGHVVGLMGSVWCLNRHKNTPIFGKAEYDLKLKVIISSFNFRVLWFPESVASYCKMRR